MFYFFSYKDTALSSRERIRRLFEEKKKSLENPRVFLQWYIICWSEFNLISLNLTPSVTIVYIKRLSFYNLPLDLLSDSGTCLILIYQSIYQSQTVLSIYLSIYLSIFCTFSSFFFLFHFFSFLSFSSIVSLSGSICLTSLTMPITWYFFRKGTLIEWLKGYMTFLSKCSPPLLLHLSGIHRCSINTYFTLLKSWWRFIKTQSF